MADIAQTEPVVKKKTIKKDYIAAVGRRREAIARIRLYSDVNESVKVDGEPAQKGQILLNGKLIEKTFGDKASKAHFESPLKITGTLGKFVITIRVSGGGKSGQLGAIVHGLARALSAYDTEKFRAQLKKKGMLTRDARVRERRKVGTGGKARRKKQSPKR